MSLIFYWNTNGPIEVAIARNDKQTLEERHMILPDDQITVHHILGVFRDFLFSEIDRAKENEPMLHRLATSGTPIPLTRPAPQ